MNSIQAMQFTNLILAYWTPERVELWNQYEKTDKSIPWREYEQMNRKESQLCKH